MHTTVNKPLVLQNLKLAALVLTAPTDSSAWC